MAEVLAPKPVTTPTSEAAPRKYNQVLKQTDPHGTPEQLRAAGLDLEKYGSCAPSRMQRVLDKEDRVRGCSCWKECTLLKIKGKAGPINLPYRLYKKGGKVRAGWGPCYTVFRMAGQYNLGNENFVMEILPLNAKVDVPISKLVSNGEGGFTWVDEMDTQTVPAFPQIGDHGHLMMEQQAGKVRKERLAQRRQEMIDRTLDIGPEDVEEAAQ